MVATFACNKARPPEILDYASPLQQPKKTWHAPSVMAPDRSGDGPNVPTSHSPMLPLPLPLPAPLPQGEGTRAWGMQAASARASGEHSTAAAWEEATASWGTTGGVPKPPTTSRQGLWVEPMEVEGGAATDATGTEEPEYAGGGGRSAKGKGTLETRDKRRGGGGGDEMQTDAETKPYGMVGPCEALGPRQDGNHNENEVQ